MGRLIFLLSVALLVLGCGTSSNNDQGRSVGFIAWRGDCAATTPPYISQISIPIGELTEPGQNAGASALGVVIENRLSAQFFTAQRLILNFFVPGADSQPPSTSVAAAVRIPQAQSAEAGSLGCTVVFVIPAEIKSWISLNRASLPEPPFTLEVDGYIRGVTAAGDVLETNSNILTVQVTPEILIPPTPGEGGGAVGGGGTDGGAGGGADGGGGTAGGGTGAGGFVGGGLPL
ncbi:MAG TPA: hypothetical protein PKD37_05475 [Oligoflexia bacterium]|nr:hypothetical protein [Oligoflexia bacterium]HMP27416.1 hypothetical protein [Oligoflexia bacterium]